MRGRIVVVVLGLILTMVTGGVLSYPRGLRGEAVGRPMAAVVVLQVDVPAGTDMDRLIWLEQFRLIEVPQEAAVDGAVTSIDQLRGARNREAILAGEQIPIALFWSVGAMRRERLEFLGG